MNGSFSRIAVVALLLAISMSPACTDELADDSPVPETPVQPPHVPAPPADPLAPWFAQGFAGKTLVFWGNSTVSQAVYFFDQLKGYAVAGGALEGLDPARILNYGNNGASLAAMLNHGGSYPIEAVVAAQPDLLVIRGPLINDVRLGATSQQAAEQLLTTMLDRLRAGTPRTAILLTTENSLLTTDVANRGYVRPNSAAQQYSDLMRAAVLAMKGRYPNVRVLDVMELEYGTVSQASSPYMWDQLHPSDIGQRTEAEIIANLIGKQQP
jgi:lysophospholipase L1-like esterase